MSGKSQRSIQIPEGSSLTVDAYRAFLYDVYTVMSETHHYFGGDEDVNSLELAHIIPTVPETVIGIYVGINDAVCNKGLVAPFLVRHAHKNVFVFDPVVFKGGDNVPDGTVDASCALNGFEPPNSSWDLRWTYVMIEDPARSVESLWREKGYIDMIAAKFEDFTMLSDTALSKVCFFIDEKAFDHPVNAGRKYLSDARKRGDATAHEFTVPTGMAGETEGLVPAQLNRGEKLYVATPDYSPCAHAWSNIHPANETYAVVNENSAVPLELIIAKPTLKPEYGLNLIPAKGSADMTTDWFFRGLQVVRMPLLRGLVSG